MSTIYKSKIIPLFHYITTIFLLILIPNSGYYSTTDHLPYLLWRISVEDLTTFIQPETAVFDDKPSTIPSKKDNTFDKCHVDIQNISDDKREEFANIYCKPPNIYICIEGEEVPLDEPEFRNLKNWTKEKGYFKEKGRYT